MAELMCNYLVMSLGNVELKIFTHAIIFCTQVVMIAILIAPLISFMKGQKNKIS